MMNPLTNILPVGQVLLDLESTSKKRVFEQVGMLFENYLGLARAVVFDSLFAREKLGSTGLGQGVAIPHGRIKGLKHATVLNMLINTPVPFDAPDGRAVNLLFFLLVPEQATEHHLEILSELAQRFAERSFRDALVAAPDSAAVVALFQN